MARPIKEALSKFYEEHPEQLGKLVKAAHDAACEGNKGMFDSIVELVDGPPPKFVAPITQAQAEVIVTAVDALRAEETVAKIREMDKSSSSLVAKGSA